MTWFLKRLCCFQARLRNISFLQTQPAGAAAALPHLRVFPTWKRELWPCSLAGLRGATGLRLLQKWMPDSRGLWASSKPLGVCGRLESVGETNMFEKSGCAARIAPRASNAKHAETVNGRALAFGKNKLMEQEGSLWFLFHPPLPPPPKQRGDARRSGGCWFGGRYVQDGKTCEINFSLSLSPLVPPSLPLLLSPVSPQRSEPVLRKDPALLPVLMELLEHMASLRASSTPPPPTPPDLQKCFLKPFGFSLPFFWPP